MRALIVSYYFPPAGGGGVQRVLKLCKHLPAFGWDVDVLAPDDPKWLAHDPGLAAEIPSATVVHRARYRGPSDERPVADVLAGARGLSGVATRAGIYGRQLLLPDPRIVWVPDAARAAVRIVRERSASVVLTTSPPSSAHMVGSLVARRTGVPWVADMRDSWLANPHRRYEARSVRLKRAVLETMARRTFARVSAVTTVTDTIAEEARALARPGTPTTVISNGCDFDEFAGLEHTPSDRLRILHAGFFFGKRTPRPFLVALSGLLADRPELRDVVEARFVGGFRTADREWAEDLGLGGSLRIDGFLPHDQALAAMKNADALLLLIPRSGGLGTSVLSGKLFEYLAAERPVLALVPPEGVAADLLRSTGFARIADPDDVAGIRAQIEDLVEAWQAGGLGDRPLPADLRERLDRRTRASEMADVLRSVA
ncbi:MAG TPA: glycosyltransferase family 4 protein [Gaiellales bacterium]